MRAKEEIEADCLRVTDVIARLVQVAAEVGDSPIFIQDEYGAEYTLVEVNHDTGDCGFILEPKSRYQE